MALVDYGADDLGIKGYLKCDIVMFYENHNMINNLILSKPLGSTIEDIKFNKKFVQHIFIIHINIY